MTTRQINDTYSTNSMKNRFDKPAFAVAVLVAAYFYPFMLGPSAFILDEAAQVLIPTMLFYWISWTALRGTPGNRHTISKMWHATGVLCAALAAGTAKMALFHFHSGLALLAYAQKSQSREAILSLLLPAASACAMAFLLKRHIATRPHSRSLISPDNPLTKSSTLTEPSGPLENSRIINDPYLMALQEIESGNYDRALWAKAFALESGNESATTAHYIRLRVAALEQDQRP